jgi:hypothetical protein
MRSFVCALGCGLVLAASAYARESSIGKAVIAPGQEELAATMLGRGEALPGDCRLSRGRIAYASLAATYRCGGENVRIELVHPSRAPEGALRVGSFAVVVRQGTPPSGLIDALAARIRSRGDSFQWTVLVEPEPPPPAAPAPVPAPGGDGRAWIVVAEVVAGCGLLAALWWGGTILARNPETLWLVVLSVVGIGLRAWLSWINWGGGDHLEVAELILKNGWQPPEPAACFQCAHPKLYPYLLAAALEGTGGDRALAARIGRLVNVAAGSAVLGLLWSYSKRQGHSVPVRFSAYAFLSLNAAFLLASSWGQNDALCILFSSLTIWWLMRFVTRRAWSDVATATVFAILAALSKATGWAIFAAGAVVLCLHLLAADQARRRRWRLGLVVFVLGFTSVVLSSNPYRGNLARSGTPFVNDAFDVPMMRFEVPRPPVAWIVEDFFTFRIVSLLKQPYIDFDDQPPHRTSLWTQLHGWTYFLQYTPFWERERSLVLGRICLVLGLLPFAALVVGSWLTTSRIIEGVRSRGVRWFADHTDWHALVYVATMLAAMAALVTRYHRWVLLWAWMNPVYLMPAILPFYALLLDGLEAMWRRWPRWVIGGMTALVLASLVDLGQVLYRLIAVSVP